MKQRTKKLIIMHRTLYPKDDVDKLYISIKEAGNGLAGIENCVGATIKELEKYPKKQRKTNYSRQ